MVDLSELAGTSPSASEICAVIEAEILSGRLRGNDRLPAVRTLAEQLRVSATTVSSAYQQLRRRGLAVGARRRGTIVTNSRLTGMPLLPSVPSGARNLADSNPDPNLLPDLTAALAGLEARPRLYGEESDNPELVAFVRTWLGTDGVDAEDIAVLNGGVDGMERVLRARLRVGDLVAVEDPGYSILREMLTAIGLRPIGVRVDDHGMLPEGLDRALRAGAKALVSTPRAQNPYGCHMTPERAAELRTVIDRSPSVLVVEDDHAPGLDHQPLSSLTAGHAGPWAVVRSPAKLIGPDLRIAFVTGDADTVARVRSGFLIGPGWVSTVIQGVTLAVLKHVRDTALEARTSAVYAARQASVVGPLSAHGLEVHGASGFNVWLLVPDEAAFVQAMLNHGWAVAGGQRFRLDCEPAVRITTATLQPNEAADLVVQAVATLAGRTLTRHG